MKPKINKFINIFIKKYADFFFFCLFVFSIPFGKRHIFNLSSSVINGNFIEWKAYSLYLSDILLFFTILFWCIKLIIIHFDKVKYQYILKYQQLSTNYTQYIWLFFVILAIISLLETNILTISIYQTVKLLEYTILFIYIYKTISSYSKIICTIITFIFSAFFQSIIALYQYFFQKSIGLNFLGEQIISPDTENIAKIVFHDNKLIRAYGTMPHANVLSGYLLIALLFCITLILLFALNKANINNVPRGTLLYSSNSSQADDKLFHVEQLPYLFNLSPNISLALIITALITISFAFVLTFSYSAYLGLFISISIYILFLCISYKNNRNKLRYKLSIINKFSNYYLLLILFILFVSFITFLPEITAKFTNIENVDDFTVQGRVEYVKIALNNILHNPEFGTGAGTFIYTINDYYKNNLDIPYWFYNPVHNVLLLIGSELGITCLLLFILLFGWVIGKSFVYLIQAKMTKFILLSTLIIINIGIFVIMQLDHYFWTIQQGSLCLFLSLGLITTLNTKLSRI